jgi:hypothetical protein
MIEMATFEECGLLGREVGHAHDYLYLPGLHQNHPS